MSNPNSIVKSADTLKGLFLLLPLDTASTLDAKIIAAGPLCKQPGTVARRAIIFEQAQKNENDHDNFGVSWQCFPRLTADKHDLDGVYYDHGSYNLDIADAQIVFADRLNANAKTMLSLLRE